LPRAASQPAQTKPDSIDLSIDAQGGMYWNKESVDIAQLNNRIAQAAKKNPQPELHLRAERTTQYEKVVQVMAAAQNGGLEKIGFVTDPQAR
jgi:biopolymer transport protein ExbD